MVSGFCKMAVGDLVVSRLATLGYEFIITIINLNNRNMNNINNFFERIDSLKPKLKYSKLQMQILNIYNNGDKIYKIIMFEFIITEYICN